jgi:hypothetical protein
VTRRLLERQQWREDQRLDQSDPRDPRFEQRPTPQGFRLGEPATLPRSTNATPMPKTTNGQ